MGPWLDSPNQALTFKWSSGCVISHNKLNNKKLQQKTQWNIPSTCINELINVSFYCTNAKHSAINYLKKKIF